MEPTNDDEHIQRRIQNKNLTTLIILTFAGSFITMMTVITVYYFVMFMEFLLLYYYSIAMSVITVAGFTSLTYNKVGSDGNKKAFKLLLFGINSALVSILLLKVPPSVLVSSLKLTVCALPVLCVITPFVPKSALDSIPRPMQSLNFVTLLTSAYYGTAPNEGSPSIFMVKDLSKFGGLLAYASLFVCNIHTLYGNIKNSNFDPICTAGIMYVNILSLYLKVISFIANACTFEFYCDHIETADS